MPESLDTSSNSSLVVRLMVLSPLLKESLKATLYCLLVGCMFLQVDLQVIFPLQLCVNRLFPTKKGNGNSMNLCIFGEFSF